MLGLCIMAQDIPPTIIAFNLEIAIVRCQPAINHRYDLDAVFIQVKAARSFLAAITRITFDPYGDGHHDGLSLLQQLVDLLFGLIAGDVAAAFQPANHAFAQTGKEDLIVTGNLSPELATETFDLTPIQNEEQQINDLML